MTWRIASLSISSLVLAVGCASFSERPAPPQYKGPSQQVILRLTTDERARLQVGRDEWIDMPFTADLASSASQAIWRSGWVRPTQSGSSTPQLTLHILEEQSQGPGLLPMLTVFVIPGVVDHRVTLDAAFSVSDGSTLQCSRAVEMRTWYQTALIFVYPFRSPAHGRLKATEALALQCLSELLQRAGYDEG